MPQIKMRGLKQRLFVN